MCSSLTCGVQIDLNRTTLVAEMDKRCRDRNSGLRVLFFFFNFSTDLGSQNPNPKLFAIEISMSLRHLSVQKGEIWLGPAQIRNCTEIIPENWFPSPACPQRCFFSLTEMLQPEIFFLATFQEI